MESNSEHISAFGEILLFIIGGFLFIAISLLISRLIRPHRPNPEKLSTYESGEEISSPAWIQFNTRFYVVALIFLLFEAEMIFLFPWATVFADPSLNHETAGQWGWVAVVEAVIFVIVLALGLVYAWVNGSLDWIKPEPQTTNYQSPVPRALYDDVNRKYQSKEKS